MMDDPSLKREPRGIAAGRGGEMEGPRRKSRDARVGCFGETPVRVSSNVPSRAASHARDSRMDDDVSLTSLRFIDRLQTMR